MGLTTDVFFHLNYVSYSSVEPHSVSSALYSYTYACFNFHFHGGGLMCALHEGIVQSGGYMFRKRELTSFSNLELLHVKNAFIVHPLFYFTFMFMKIHYFYFLYIMKMRLQRRNLPKIA